jgi:hypothetical protein
MIRCPRCNCRDRVVPSHRRGLDFLLFLLLLRPYRCNACFKRFLVPLWSADNQTLHKVASSGFPKGSPPSTGWRQESNERLTGG